MTAGPDLRFGEFVLRRGQARLERAGVVVPLQPKVFDALELFATRSGELLPKEFLLAELWPEVIVGEEALTQLIRKLRQALADDPREPRYLETVMKRGYRFVAAVELAEPDPRPSSEPAVPEPAPPEPQPKETPPAKDSPLPARPQPAASGVRRAVVALALLAAVVAGFALRRQSASSEGGGAKRLTAQPEREQEGVISPDGRSFAFEANLAGQFDLFLASFAGGQRIQLTQTAADDEYFPQFAADGQTIYFSRAPVEGGPPSLWVIPTLGGEERLLIPDASYGSPSPDGSRIAFARYLRDGRFALLVRETLTGSDRELARTDEWLGSASWSPDGRNLAFATPSAVWTVGADGSNLRPVVRGLESVRTVAWSPDGETLIHDGAAQDGLSRLRLFDLASARSAIVPAPSAAWHPSFSRDGRRLLVTVEHKTRQLWRVGADGREFLPLPLPTTAECFDVDPRSERLAVNDWQAAPRSAPVELVELATGRTRALGDGLCPAFSPDGELVAFLRMRGETTDLVAYELATGASRVVATDLGDPGFVEANLDRRPAWSPDGSRLLVESLDAAGRSLTEIDFVSGRRRELLRGEFGPAAYASDGRAIVVCGASPLGSGLHWIDTSAGAARLVGELCSYRSAPALRADGRAIAFLADERSRPAIVAVDLQGGLLAERVALAVPADPAFWGVFDARPLASGGWVVLSERYEGDLFLLER